MTPFDLVFIAVFLFTFASLIWIAGLGLRHRATHALRHLRRLLLYDATYLAVVVAVGLISPRRILSGEEVLRFDDWCLGVERAKVLNHLGALSPRAGNKFVVVPLKIINEARRVRQAAPKGSTVYLVDDRAGHYGVSMAGQEAFEKENGIQPPLTTKLDAGTSIQTVRIFEVPTAVRALFLATRHGSWFPRQFIIGDGFRRPAVLSLRLETSSGPTSGNAGIGVADRASFVAGRRSGDATH